MYRLTDILPPSNEINIVIVRAGKVALCVSRFLGSKLPFQGELNNSHSDCARQLIRGEEVAYSQAMYRKVGSISDPRGYQYRRGNRQMDMHWAERCTLLFARCNRQMEKAKEGKGQGSIETFRSAFPYCCSVGGIDLSIIMMVIFRSDGCTKS